MSFQPATARYTTAMQDILSPLIDLAHQQWRRHGATPGAGGLRLTLGTRPDEVIHGRYAPSLCVVLQGAKTSFLGERAFRYEAGQCLIATHDVPVRSEITAASASAPYMALSLALEPAVIAELMLEPALRRDVAEDRRTGPALRVAALDPRLAEPLCRLLALLDRPRDLQVLAPMVRREIAWLMLSGPLAALVRPVGLADTGPARIGVSLRWIRDHFTEALSVPDLAARAGMSPATFHRQFKAVTQMTPVQYQKRLRLQEARRLLVSGGTDVAGAAFATGYESPSQFGRDYRRLFGAPPGRDGQSLRRRLAARIPA